MIRFFLPPYPDELLYSLIARFIVLMGYAPVTARTKLFGSDNGGVSIEFPGRLAYFCSQIPWPDIFTAENILQNHTIFPLYSPFLSEARRRNIRERMMGANSNGIYWHLGDAALAYGTPTHLKYCPLCYQSDQKEFAESYWHRTHQSRWSYVCTVHNVFLEKAFETDLVRWGKTRAYLADRIERPSVPRQIASSKLDNILLGVAKDVEWLLSQPIDLLDIKMIRNGYRNLAIEQGILKNNGIVKSRNSLVDNFVSFYSNELLEFFDSPLTISRHNWLTSLFLDNGNFKLPVQHILLARFLGMGFPEFYNYSKGSSMKDLIPTKKASAPELTTDYIREIWMDPEISMNEMAKRLKRDVHGIIQYAIRLGLPFPRGVDQTSIRHGKRYKCPSEFETLKTRKREQWLQVLEDNPTLSSKYIAAKAPTLHRWLNQYDCIWLQKHKPPARLKGGKRRVDWELRDKKIAEAVPEAAKSILCQPGHPVRANKTEILARAGACKAITYLKNLPLTRRALEQNVETDESFALRKIDWAEGYYKTTSKRICRSVFIDRLKIAWSKHDPEIMDAANSAYERIREYWNSDCGS